MPVTRDVAGFLENIDARNGALLLSWRQDSDLTGFLGKIRILPPHLQLPLLRAEKTVC